MVFGENLIDTFSLPQKMELVQLPEKSYGNFYEGDCYVLLSVRLRWMMNHCGFQCFFIALLMYQSCSTPVFFQTQKVSGSPSYDTHYWIGSQSTQDEQGAAAVYTIQLDEFLGSNAVQHREVQNHESDTFRGYFKRGIM